MMGWEEALETNYPDAIPIPEWEETVRSKLQKQGFRPDNTLFANGTCRDEINKSTVERFAATWGENFNLASLGGYPTAGRTGFSAFASHVPDEGNLLILYGPHIGIGDDGALGSVVRTGMDRPTGACGALVAVLKDLEENPAEFAEPEAELDVYDLEQSRLRAVLAPAHEAVLQATHPLRRLTEEAFDRIDDALNSILNGSGCKHPIGLIGGVLINTPREAPNAFAPRRVEVRTHADDPTSALSL